MGLVRRVICRVRTLQARDSNTDHTCRRHRHVPTRIFFGFVVVDVDNYCDMETQTEAFLTVESTKSLNSSSSSSDLCFFIQCIN